MKTILLLSVPFVVAFIILYVWPHLLFGKTEDPLVIRIRDRRIFEASCPDEFPTTEAWCDGECVRPYYFREVVWVQNSWLPGGRFEPTGLIWEPTSHKEFDVIGRQYVEEGAKILAQRMPNEKL